MSHFLRMRDLQRGEIRRLFARAAQLKRRRREGHLEDSLAGKTVVLLIEKACTRTRLSFDAAAFQLGGHAIELTRERRASWPGASRSRTRPGSSPATPTR